MSFLEKMVGATDTVWTGYVMRGSTEMIRQLLARMREKEPGMYRRVWHIFNRASATDREVFEAALRLAIVPADLLTQALPIGGEGRDLVRDMLGDVVNEVRRNFIEAPELPLAEGETFTVPEGKENIEALAKEATHFSPRWLRKLRNAIIWIGDRFKLLKSGEKFEHQDFKQFRAALLQLGPIYERKFEALWRRLDDFGKWDLLESSEYLTAPEKIRVLLDQPPAQQNAWLATNSHDKWLNIPPHVWRTVVAFARRLHALGDAFGEVVGNLTDGLRRYNFEADVRRAQRQQEHFSPDNMRRDPRRWRHVRPGHPLWAERQRRERNRRNRIIFLRILAIYAGLTAVVFVTKHALIGSVMCAVPVIALVAFLFAVHRDGQRRPEHV